MQLLMEWKDSFHSIKQQSICQVFTWLLPLSHPTEK